MKITTGLLVSALVLLGACADNQEEDETEENGMEAEGEESEESGEVTIEHALGEEKLDEPPERIVALEWVYAENLLALDTQPVGVADMDGYHEWVNIEPQFDDDVVDVGTRQEPSIEEIARLEPDLIITAADRHEGLEDQLNDIAPTAMFDPYPGEEEGDQYEEMESTFLEMAQVLAKENEAEEILADVEESYETYAAELEGAGLDGEDIVLSQAFSANDTATIRLFTDNSLAVRIMEELELNNSFEAESFEPYGYTETNVDALEPYQDARFVYIVQEEDDVFNDQLDGNAVWEQLDFVENERIHGLPGDTWTFGGPLSAQVFAEQLTETLINE
ncbi:ABC transporter substrate-binding protein [Salsuginibacillus kocurii]|uniref:ABC transporter substrate-binding protein n=1 Tax=Salsuginibacillus kocurii TaxID=427078 RepID=UPI0003829B16|nr:iron-siderophore ABC transporter substrate-binding protein [Salsuginibacillus kocurii]